MESWSDKDKLLLSEYVLTMSNKEIATKMDKTISSIKGQLRALQITRPKTVELHSYVKGEKWKNINDTYAISNFGRVRNILTNVIRKTGVNKYGYERVTLSDNISYLIHTLVTKAFLPNPNKYPEVNHKDGVKINNHYTNLEWCTEEYNLQHALDNGLRNTLGENSPKSKIDEITAILICDMLEIGTSSTHIMKTLNNKNVSKTMIDKIRSGIRWKHISSKYAFVKKKTF